jgi:hypothetical protein
MFTVNAQGILGLTAVLMCWALAVVLFRVGMPGSVARKLAVLLLLEGWTLGTSDVANYFLVSPEYTWNQHPLLMKLSMMAHFGGDCAMLTLYPPFLAAALQTRLTRPFLDKRVRFGLAGYALVLFILTMSTPPQFGIALLYLSMTVLFGFALVAAVQAWYVATGAARSRALIFVLAFGFRDICWGIIYTMGLWELWSGQVTALTTGSANFWYILYVLGTLVAVPLIAYGILRTQLFDIDLRIRWTIKQSTFAVSVVAIVFTLSEGVEWLVSSELGDAWGLAAAAIVLFFVKPLQGFAERVVSVLMPNTQNTPEYKVSRKRQVYESAVAEAHLDGGISHKERSLLILLRDSLGISESDAEAIENEQLSPA